MKKRLLKILYFCLIILVYKNIQGAAYIIDDFNDGDASNWWLYGNANRSADNSPAIGASAIRIWGSTASGWYIGGMGISLPESLKNLSQCTSFQVSLANNEGNTSPSYGCDEFVIKAEDGDGTKVTCTIANWQNPFTSTSLVLFNIKFTSFSIETAGSTPGMDWSKVNAIMFQIGTSGTSGAGDADYNLDEIKVLGNIPLESGTPVSLDVTIQSRKSTWSSNGLNQIIFSNNIQTDDTGKDWILSDNVIAIQFSSASNNPMLVIYADNKSISADYQYSGDDLYSRLVGEDTAVIVPLIWSLYDEKISDRTNYQSTWGAVYAQNNPETPQRPVYEMNYWTNINGPYIDGYWRPLIETGSTGYSWNSIGKYYCLIAVTNEAGEFAKPEAQPLKGSRQLNPLIDKHGGIWTEYKGPFGGFYIDDNYRSNWIKGKDGLKDAVIYLAGYFKNKKIQNYKSNRIIIELIHYP